MGYTHYWTTKKRFSKEEREEIISSVIKIINNLPEHSESSGAYYTEFPIAISLENDVYTEPLINVNEIVFNGYGVNPDDDLGHESFVYEFGQPKWEFCKTARKPYDYVVQAVLLIMHNVAPDKFRVTSDGFREEWEWSRATASEVLGIELTIPDTIKSPSVGVSFN